MSQMASESESDQQQVVEKDRASSKGSFPFLLFFGSDHGRPVLLASSPIRRPTPRAADVSQNPKPTFFPGDKLFYLFVRLSLCVRRLARNGM